MWLRGRRFGYSCDSVSWNAADCMRDVSGQCPNSKHKDQQEGRAPVDLDFERIEPTRYSVLLSTTQRRRHHLLFVAQLLALPSTCCCIRCVQFRRRSSSFAPVLALHHSGNPQTKPVQSAGASGRHLMKLV